MKTGTLVAHRRYGLCYTGGAAGNRISLHNLETGKRLCQNARIADYRPRSPLAVAIPFPPRPEGRGLHGTNRMTNTNLQLEPPDNIARKQEQCEDQASVRQALVQPFLLHTLGYDVFDPMTTMPDTTGATYDAELLHPDARVDYAIRRNGLPALLIAVHGPSTDLPDRIDKDAQVRLAQCMEQSTAEIGAITDGRRWTWHAKLQNTGTVAFHRTDLVHPTAEDIGIIEAISQTGWNKKTLMDYAQGVMYEARIQASLLKELSNPGIEFARWMASLVHQGPKSPKLLELIHQRLPGAIEKALRTLQETDAEGVQNAGAAAPTGTTPGRARPPNRCSACSAARATGPSRRPAPRRPDSCATRWTFWRSIPTPTASSRPCPG